MSPQPAKTKEQTAAEKRQAEILKDAQAHVKGYKPNDNAAVFNGSRSYVEAQFAIAEDIQARAAKLLEEKEVNRTTIRGLYTQGLLTPEEAETAFVVYPYRPPNRGGASDTNGDAS
jgi:hypothetical protein